jgi:Ser/Thr protein kinase RdoA (MazF antagonist)
MPFEKRRDPAPPGSIPDVLDMWVSEVRFYREIARAIDVRVPELLGSTIAADGGTRLVLEDLSAWSPGGDSVSVARVLRSLHAAWMGTAQARWPWLRLAGAAAELIGTAFDRAWPALAARGDLTPAVRAVGEGLVGHVVEAELAEAGAGPLTLCHGDACLGNVFTSPSGEIALVDWEDVRCGPGASDLAWLLVSSVAPHRWDAVIEAYGSSVGLREALPASMAQELHVLRQLPEGDPAAAASMECLAAAHEWLARTT